MDERQRRLKEALLSRRPVTPADPAWGDALLKRLEPLPKGLDFAITLCRDALREPAGVAHPQWPAVVRGVLDLTWAWADACRTLGGFEPPEDPADDDSGMDQQYETLHTFDAVLGLLAAPAPLEHPRWAELVEAVVQAKREKVPELGFGKDAARALRDVAREHGRATPDLDAALGATWRLDR